MNDTLNLAISFVTLILMAGGILEVALRAYYGVSVSDQSSIVLNKIKDFIYWKKINIEKEKEKELKDFMVTLDDLTFTVKENYLNKLLSKEQLIIVQKLGLLLYDLKTTTDKEKLQFFQDHLYHDRHLMKELINSLRKGISFTHPDIQFSLLLIYKGIANAFKDYQELITEPLKYEIDILTDIKAYRKE